jgi:arylsulfatase K
MRSPHFPFRTSDTWLDRIDPAKVDIPPLDESDHPVLAHQRVDKNWEHGFSDEMIALVRRVYFAMIAELDARVGMVLDAVREAGLADSTVVVFSSDHGEMAMEHRQVTKSTAFEGSVHVPLIVRGPGVEAGQRIDTPVSLIDLYPTFMDMTSLACPEGLDGSSLMPMLQGEPLERRGGVLSEYHDATSCASWFMLREGDRKYIAYVGYDPQLFNLAEDPDEIHDLVNVQPARAAEMDRKLRRVVDYEAVAGKVRAYDQTSFRAWRAEQQAAGEYESTMARIHSGWNHFEDQGRTIQPWTDEDEARIEDWLAKG